MSIEDTIIFQQYNIKGYDTDLTKKVTELSGDFNEKVTELQESC